MSDSDNNPAPSGAIVSGSLVSSFLPPSSGSALNSPVPSRVNPNRFVTPLRKNQFGDVATGRVHMSFGSARGRTLWKGPEGGVYFLSPGGTKQYR